MEEQDIGIRDIREKLGISQATAKKLVLGRNVNFDTLIKISFLNKKIPKIVWDEPKSQKKKKALDA